MARVENLLEDTESYLFFVKKIPSALENPSVKVIEFKDGSRYVDLESYKRLVDLSNLFLGVLKQEKDPFELANLKSKEKYRNALLY